MLGLSDNTILFKGTGKTRLRFNIFVAGVFLGNYENVRKRSTLINFYELYGKCSDTFDGYDLCRLLSMKIKACY